jgi:nucleotide-binding universal stress UspA family protein
MYRNILVPTDGSELSLRAVKQAVTLAREQKARITALHVTRPYRVPGGEDGSVYRYVTPRDHAEAEKKIAGRHLGRVEQAAARAGVRCDSVQAVSDYPFDEIVRAASRRKCDLICMGSHGRTGLSRLLLGSQTSRVLALSKVPVLVVR